MSKQLKVVDVRLPKRPGVSLASDFVTYVFDNYGDPNDPELFDAATVLFRVHTVGFPFTDVIDFHTRLKDLNDSPHVGGVEMVHTNLVDATRTPWPFKSSTMRCMRTLEGKHTWTNEQGSLLVHEDIAELIQALYEKAFMSEPKTVTEHLKDLQNG